MNAQQVVAFNSASGTTTNELLTVILTIFFVLAVFWAVIILIGKLKAMVKDQDIDVFRMSMIALRVLAILVVVLFLINI